MGNVNLINNCDDEKTDKTGRCESNWNYIDKGNFGNHKKITANLLRTYAEDLHYLKDETDDLWDSTDPICRHVSTPTIDKANSWSIIQGTDNNYHFDNRTRFTGSTLFKNYNTIDKDNTTAYIDTVNGCATIPPQTQDIVTTTECQGPNKGGLAGCNAHWYISYNRTKTYTIQDKWREDLDNTEIPAISRKQTFKPKTSGKLETLTVNLTGSSSAEYPLIVQIFDEETTPVTEIAKTEYKFTTQTGGGLTAFAFETAPLLTKDHKYSFVLRSPLTSYKNHYGVGGWGKTCNVDPYKDGECYLSENNASKLGTWIRHGRTEKTLSYHNGKNQPIDFGFQCGIRPAEPIYDTSKEYIIYFKTQQMNPAKEIRLYAEDEIPTGTEIHYEVSTNGKDWTEFPTGTANRTIYFDKTSIFVTLRARLKTTDKNVTPKINNVAIECQLEPPKKAYLRTQFYNPEKAQILGASVWSGLRAPYYYTPKERIFNSDGSQQVQVLVDVVRNTTIKENWKLVKVSEMKKYIEEYYIEKYKEEDKDLDGYVDDRGNITRLNEEGISVAHRNSLTELLNTLSTDEAILNHLRQVDTTEGDGTTKDNEIMTWINNNRRVFIATETKEFKLSEFPAYPLLHVSLQKANTEEEENKILEAEKNGETYTPEPTFENYKEWVDYQIGIDGTYDTPVLYFGTSENPTSISEGDLTVEYNPLWIRGLKESDFISIINEDVFDLSEREMLGLDESVLTDYPNDVRASKFKMDVFTDAFTITSDSLVDFTLSVNPLQALREVWIRGVGDIDVDLVEGVDFTVDYLNRTLHLNSEVSVGDTLFVKYTPYLVDEGLGLAYRCERVSSDVDVSIPEYYFEYRV